MPCQRQHRTLALTGTTVVGMVNMYSAGRSGSSYLVHVVFARRAVSPLFSAWYLVHSTRLDSLTWHRMSRSNKSKVIADGLFTCANKSKQTRLSLGYCVIVGRVDQRTVAIGRARCWLFAQPFLGVSGIFRFPLPRWPVTYSSTT